MKSLIPMLAVNDVDASVRYYTEVLGFAASFTMPGPDRTTVHASVERGAAHVMLGKDDASCGGEGQPPRGAGVVLYFTVEDDEDIDAYFARVTAAGAKVVQEPMDQFWGHRDWGIADPDGYLLYISKQVGAMDLSAVEGTKQAEPALVPAD